MSNSSTTQTRWKITANAWGPAVAMMAVLFIVSAQPSLPTPPHIWGFDKIEHFSAYMVLGLLVFRAAFRLPITKSGPYLHSFVLSAVYGMSDEFHQRFVPNRSFDVFDWIADVLGVCLGLVIVWAITRALANGGDKIGRTRSREDLRSH